MLDGMVAAAFEHVEEAAQVAVEIGVRALQRVTHPGLRGEMHDRARPLALDQRVPGRLVRDVERRDSSPGKGRDARVLSADSSTSECHREEPLAARGQRTAHVGGEAGAPVRARGRGREIGCGDRERRGGLTDFVVSVSCIRWASAVSLPLAKYALGRAGEGSPVLPKPPALPN